LQPEAHFRLHKHRWRAPIEFNHDCCDRFKPSSFHHRPVRFGAGELSTCPAFAETVAGHSPVHTAPPSLCYHAISGAFYVIILTIKVPPGNRPMDTLFLDVSMVLIAVGDGFLRLFCGHPLLFLQSLFINKHAKKLAAYRVTGGECYSLQWCYFVGSNANPITCRSRRILGKQARAPSRSWSS
jgi:hypothetical protein